MRVAPWLCAWMGPAVDVPDPLAGDVRVELRGGDTRMAEQLLDDAQVGSPLEEVRRERVAQGVRADPVLEAGCRRGGLDRRPGLLPGEAATPIAHEQRSASERCDVGQGEQRHPRTA